MDRRRFLTASSLLLAGFPLAYGRALAAVDEAPATRLRAGMLQKKFAEFAAPVAFWGYNGQAPGPQLRYRKGERLRIDLENTLAQGTTLHWHGLRVPNAMDGVPLVTQAPVQKGERFRYEFELKDSGTYWYHPHQKSFEQVGRGMCGALIVEEEKPIEVDRELVWVLNDFQIDPASGEHSPFGQISDHATKGRWGNLITVNGESVASGRSEVVRAGERIRLRLINAATARVFKLEFSAGEPRVIAYDGQAVRPALLSAEDSIFGPGMRLDLVLDVMLPPGAVLTVADANSRSVLGRLACSAEAPLRDAPSAAPIALAPNERTRPNLAKAVHHTIDFLGGDAGPPVIGAVDGRQIPYGEMKSKYGLAWTVNSHAASEDAHHHEPLLIFGRGKTYVIAMTNKTGFDHPIHLHGHFFRVLALNGEKLKHEVWRDTVMLTPWSDVVIALVAEEPGDWMFHCHVLEHAAAGMMAVVRVE